MDDNQQNKPRSSFKPENQPRTTCPEVPYESSFEQLSEEDMEAMNAMDSMHKETGYDQYSTYASWMEGWTPEYYYRVTLKGLESYGHELCFEFLTDQAAIKFAMGLLSGGARCRKVHRGSPNSQEISGFSISLNRIVKKEADDAERKIEEAHARYIKERDERIEADRVKEESAS